MLDPSFYAYLNAGESFFPPLCSSSTRSMTSSEFFFFFSLLSFGGAQNVFLLTHLFLLSPTQQQQPHCCGFSASAFKQKKTKYNNKTHPPEKGVRIAGWNSPNTTSDKTFLWRCAVFPHKNKQTQECPIPIPSSPWSFAIGHGRASFFYPLPFLLHVAFGPFVNSVPIVALQQYICIYLLSLPKYEPPPHVAS